MDPSGVRHSLWPCRASQCRAVQPYLSLYEIFAETSPPFFVLPGKCFIAMCCPVYYCPKQLPAVGHISPQTLTSVLSLTSVTQDSPRHFHRGGAAAGVDMNCSGFCSPALNGSDRHAGKKRRAGRPIRMDNNRAANGTSRSGKVPREGPNLGNYGSLKT